MQQKQFPRTIARTTSHVVVWQLLDDDTIVTNVLPLCGEYFWAVYVGGTSASLCIMRNIFIMPKWILIKIIYTYMCVRLFVCLSVCERVYLYMLYIVCIRYKGSL